MTSKLETWVVRRYVQDGICATRRLHKDGVANQTWNEPILRLAVCDHHGCGTGGRLSFCHKAPNRCGEKAHRRRHRAADTPLASISDSAAIGSVPSRRSRRAPRRFRASRRGVQRPSAPTPAERPPCSTLGGPSAARARAAPARCTRPVGRRVSPAAPETWKARISMRSR